MWTSNFPTLPLVTFLGKISVLFLRYCSARQGFCVSVNGTYKGLSLRRCDVRCSCLACCISMLVTCGGRLSSLAPAAMTNRLRIAAANSSAVNLAENNILLFLQDSSFLRSSFNSLLFSIFGIPRLFAQTF